MSSARTSAEPASPKEPSTSASESAMLAPAKAAARKPTNVMPIWIDGQKRAGLLDQAVDPSGAPVALVAELAHAAAPDRDERDLGGHEHAVEQDEQGDDEELGQGAAHQSTSSPSTAGMVGAGSVAGSRLDVTGRRCAPARPTASLPAGTSRVTTEPAPV